MTSKIILSVGVVCTTVMLTGCENPKKILGLERNKPDEFTVIKQAPLTMPPNYQDLPTPTPGMDKKDHSASRDSAKRIIFGEAGIDQGTKSEGEIALLQKAGVEKRDLAIRQQVNSEARLAAKGNESFVRDLLAFKKDKLGKVIDPRVENRALNGKEHPSEVS